MHRLAPALLALGLIASPAPGQTLRPLVTEDVETLPDGELEIQVSMDVVADFQSLTQPLEGSLVRFPVLGVNFGLGDRTEIQIGLPLRQRFSPDNEPTRSATGDLTLATKLRFFGGKGVVPGLGARAKVKLPNINAETGIATQETDVAIELLAGIDLGGALVATSVGLAILGDPFKAASQNDKLIFGAGVFLPLGLFDVGADLHGLVLGDDSRPSQWSAIAGLAKNIGRVRLDGGAGFSSREGKRSFRFTVGLTTVIPLRP